MHVEQITAFLAEPMRMAQVAAVSPRRAPLLGSLWYLFDEGQFWFSSHPSSPLAQSAARQEAVAVIVDDFTPPDRIRQVRVRGPAAIHDHDGHKVRAIYERYLGQDTTTWPDFFQDRADDAAWTLWSMSPSSGVATVNPAFRPIEVRWDTPSESPLAAG